MIDMRNKKHTIVGDRIYLKVLEETNATEEYCHWLNDPEVNKYLETKSATIEDLRKYIKDKFESSNCLFFGIFLNDGNKHIGNLKLEPIDFEKMTAVFGIMIGEKKYWGRGICYEASKLIVDWSFEKLNLREIKLGVIAENKAAVRAYEKVGFKVDNVIKKSIKFGNNYYNKILMSIKR